MGNCMDCGGRRTRVAKKGRDKNKINLISKLSFEDDVDEEEDEKGDAEEKKKL